MTSIPGGSHRRDVVHPRRLDTLGILVASRDPCLAIATEDALKQTGRKFSIVAPEEVKATRFPRSWAMGVILCPGDDTEELAHWAKRRTVHPGRVSFYYHFQAEPGEVLRAWSEAGLAIPSAWPVAKWSDLSRKFGAHLNSVSHDDFCPDADCRFRELR